MCDYSLMHAKSRPAAVGDRLTVKGFGTGTIGFAAPEDPGTAVCLLPGTEVAFEAPILAHAVFDNGWYFVRKGELRNLVHQVARFRQIRKDEPMVHHDALELPDGELVMVTLLSEGQVATVLQLPAKPKTAAEAQEQTRVEVVA